MDWSDHYPKFIMNAELDDAAKEEQGQESPVVKRLSKQVEVADIGCGFGGLLFALALRMPETLLLGELVESKPSFLCYFAIGLNRATFF